MNKKHTKNKQRNFPRKCENLKYKERKKQKIFREKNENKKRNKRQRKRERERERE